MNENKLRSIPWENTHLPKSEEYISIHSVQGTR